jgi:RNA polymerase sigma-70 factor (ECF subfamily)
MPLSFTCVNLQAILQDMPARDVQRDELVLLQDVLDRRPGAWNEFYQRYQRLIVACIRKVLNRYGVPCLPQEIEDLVSMACLELIRNDYKKLRSYNAERGYKLSSWVGLIATNTAHDSLRRRGPPTQSLEEVSHPWAERPDHRPAPDEMTELKEKQRLLEEAVKYLSPAEQTFLRHYYQDGMEPTEIAELLGISINTVYSRKNKVRSSLKRVIELLKPGTI